METHNFVESEEPLQSLKCFLLIIISGHNIEHIKLLFNNILVNIRNLSKSRKLFFPHPTYFDAHEDLLIVQDFRLVFIMNIFRHGFQDLKLNYLGIQKLSSFLLSFLDNIFLNNNTSVLLE